MATSAPSTGINKNNPWWKCCSRRLRRQDVQLAMDLLAEMAEREVQQDMIVFNSAINAAANTGGEIVQHVAAGSGPTGRDGGEHSATVHHRFPFIEQRLWGEKRQAAASTWRVGRSVGEHGATRHHHVQCREQCQ